MVLPKACTGFEFGFHDAVSMTKGNTGRAPFSTWTVGAGSSIQVLSTPSPRSGSYFCRLQMAATATFFGWSSGIFGTGQRTMASSFWIRLPTALPTADTRFWIVDMPTSANISLRFRNSDDTLVMCADDVQANGAVGPAVVADTWYHVFVYMDCTTTSRVVQWWVDGVAQTDSTHTASAVEDMGPWIWGSSGSGITITEDIDDWVLWTDTVAMTGLPFGPHKVLLLKPDTGGTTTEFGTANRTARMVTNSAADATHNSANILAALSEVPPLLGATATGVAQRVVSTVADTDGVGIPMTSYTLAAGESIAGLRLEIVGWASAATANSLGIKTFNGTTLTGLEAGFTYDPNFDNNTTSPGWYCRMLAEAEYDTQAELDAWQVRLGYSDDISPLPGAHAVYGELAVKEAVPAAVTVDPATLVLSAAEVTVGGTGAAAVTVDPATVVLSAAEVTAAAGGPPGIAVDPATVVLSATEVAVGGTGVAAVAVDAATVVLSATDPVVGGTGVAAVAVDAATVVLSATEVAFAPSGAVARVVDPATVILSATEVVLAGSGLVSRTVDPATVVLTAAEVALAGSGVAVRTVDPATLLLTGAEVTFAPSGAVARTVDPATVVLTGAEVTVAVAGGPQAWTVDAAGLALSAAEVVLAGTGVAARTVDPATVTLTAAEVALGGAGAVPLPVDAALLLLTAADVLMATGAGLTVDPAGLLLTGVDVAVGGTGLIAVPVDPAILLLTAADIIVIAADLAPIPPWTILRAVAWAVELEGIGPEPELVAFGQGGLMEHTLKVGDVRTLIYDFRRSLSGITLVQFQVVAVVDGPLIIDRAGVITDAAAGLATLSVLAGDYGPAKLEMNTRYPRRRPFLLEAFTEPGHTTHPNRGQEILWLEPVVT